MNQAIGIVRHVAHVVFRRRTGQSFQRFAVQARPRLGRPSPAGLLKSDVLLSRHYHQRRLFPRRV